MDSVQIYALGDQALTVAFGSQLGVAVHERVMSLHAQLRDHPFPGFLESVPAYTTLTVYVDPLSLEFQAADRQQTTADHVREILLQMISVGHAVPCSGALVKIPVCYDDVFGPDQASAAALCDVTVEELIALHSGTTYRVYMLGFVPGFPYLGLTSPRLDVPRKRVPSMRVPPGSVGIAGRQTGIYPLETPGGWHIIGRTPVPMFIPGVLHPFALKPGMDVLFEPVDIITFQSIAAGWVSGL